MKTYNPYIRPSLIQALFGRMSTEVDVAFSLAVFLVYMIMAAQFDCDIDAPAAWDTFTGSSDIVVAVIDSGMALTHEDFMGNTGTICIIVKIFYFPYSSSQFHQARYLIALHLYELS